MIRAADVPRRAEGGRGWIGWIAWGLCFLSGIVVGAGGRDAGLLPGIPGWTQGDGASFREVRGEEDFYVADGLAGHLHKPHAVRTTGWDEHPDQVLHLSTNNLGFREDADTPILKPEGTFRVLVTGDSHIDGVVPNSESFSNRLEALLNGASSRQGYEVINGGTGHYGPFNYEGFLDKFLDLRPDAFIVVVFSGNDFLDAVRTAQKRRMIEVPERPAGYMPRLAETASDHSNAVWQGLNQAYFFKATPQLQATATGVAAERLEGIARTCALQSIELFVVVLPTACDLEAGYCGEAAEKLGLGPRDVGVNRRLGERLLLRLHRQGIRTLDPLADMRHSNEKLFWRHDHHLSDRGHELLAELFFEEFGVLGAGSA
ncbi:MAG: hypothetical protein AAGN66_22060 [Acidobacteriota bacterium]